MLLNLVLRLRASYALDGGHEERIDVRIAEAADKVVATKERCGQARR